MEAIIFIGIPASGKSTYYEKHFKDTHLRLNLDMLGRRRRERALFEAAVKTGTKIVIDNTNIDLAHRQKYIPLLKKNNYKIISYYFHIPEEQSLKRNKERDRFVPEDVIWKLRKNLVQPTKDEGFDEVHIIDNGNKEE